MPSLELNLSPEMYLWRFMNVDRAKWLDCSGCGFKCGQPARGSRRAPSSRAISITHAASKIDLPLTIPNIASSKNIISPSPPSRPPPASSPRSNFELHGRVIYNSHRKFDLESRRGPLGDILCIRSPIYLLIRGCIARLYARRLY